MSEIALNGGPRHGDVVDIPYDCLKEGNVFFVPDIGEVYGDLEKMSEPAGDLTIYKYKLFLKKGYLVARYLKGGK